MKAFKLIVFSLAIASLSACASLSGTQTARTLKKGETRSVIGGGQYESSVTSGDTTVKFSKPYLEYAYRQGLNDNWDFGVKFTFVGTALADAKYNFYSDDNWAFAVGGGLGYMNISTESAGQTSEATIIDIVLPFYASYDFNEKWAVYLIPKYILRSTSGGGTSGSTNVVGANLGVKWGQKTGVMFEVGHFKESTIEDPIAQAHLAWFWTPEKAWF